MRDLLYILFSSSYSWYEKWQLLKCCFMIISNIDVPEVFNFNLLHLAAKTGDSNLLKKVVKNEMVDINQQDKNGWTALHIATYFGNMDMVKCLVNEFDADLNIKTFDNNLTSSQIAVDNLNFELTIFFIDRDYEFKDVSLPNQYGQKTRKEYLEKLYMHFASFDDQEETLENIKKVFIHHNLEIERKMIEYNLVPEIPNLSNSLPIINWKEDLESIDPNNSLNGKLLYLGNNAQHED